MLVANKERHLEIYPGLKIEHSLKEWTWTAWWLSQITLKLIAMDQLEMPSPLHWGGGKSVVGISFFARKPTCRLLLLANFLIHLIDTSTTAGAIAKALNDHHSVSITDGSGMREIERPLEELAA